MDEATEARFWERLEKQILVEIEAEGALRLYRLVPAAITSEPVEIAVRHVHLGTREVQITEAEMGKDGRIEGAYLCPETAQSVLRACMDGRVIVCCLN